jgi:hypothetical protein
MPFRMPEQPLLPFGDPLPSEAPSPKPRSRAATSVSRPPAAAPAALPPPPAAAPGVPGTSRLIEELARVCAEQPLDEKVLVAPSLPAGHTLVERLAREGHAWMNLRVETVRTLALHAVGPDLAGEGLRLLSRAQALALVEQACSETLTARSYFGLLRDRPGLHRALQKTLDELRAAGLEPEAIPVSAFTDSRKPREIRAVLARYGRLLAEGGFVDGLEVLRRAAAAATEGTALYLLPPIPSLPTSSAASSRGSPAAGFACSPSIRRRPGSPPRAARDSSAPSERRTSCARPFAASSETGSPSTRSRSFTRTHPSIRLSPGSCLASMGSRARSEAASRRRSAGRARPR